MFIRQSKVFSKKHGRGLTHRLCVSVRSGSRVRQVTLLNLGVHFPLPPARWREFTALVETLDAGGEPLFPPDPALLPIARRVVRQLRDRRRRQAMPAAGETATVQLDSLRHEPTRSVGGERLALAALDELRFAAILRAAGLPERDARLACALVTARMLHPSSEREAQAWLAGRSAVLELLGLDDRPPPSDNKLHRLGDRLWALRDELERGLARSERALCAAAPAIVFYDLTNVHYHGRPRDDLQFGRAKQKRHDCPLVTLALALDELGFPRCSEVLPGNVSEPSTLKQVLTRLADRCGPQESRPLVIMDAGIATAANLAWLRKRGYDWITVTRGKREAPPARDPDCQFRSRCGLLVRAWKRAAPEPEGAGDAPCDATGPEMRICLWSEQRQQKDDAILAGKRQRFEQRLAALHAGLSRKNCTKRYDKVLERLGRLKQRYRLVSAQYDIVVERDEAAAAQRKGPRGGKPRPVLATAVRWQLNAAGVARDARAGSYELRTSHTAWPLERVVRTYWRQTEVEATFRSLKSELGLRPVWHRRADRIRAHLFLGVLAFHAVHLLRRRLARSGLHHSWWTIRNKLAGWERVTTTLRTVSGRLIENRQDTRPRPEAERIARAAGVKPQLHRQRV